MTTADWIKRRRELLDDATGAPWEPGETQRYHDGSYHVSYSEVEPSVAAGCDPADAALIADARTSLPLALDALDAVLALLPEQGSVDEDRPAGELGYLIERAFETALEES